MDDTREYAPTYRKRLGGLSKSLVPAPKRPHRKKVERSPKERSEDLSVATVENRGAEIIERAAARFLTNCLADCYGFEVSSIHGDVWERYRRFMRARWGLGDAESRVAMECIRSLRNTRIALRLGLSAETVNRQRR